MSMSLKPKALFARSNFDLMTSYLFEYSKDLVSYARSLGYEVVDLSGEQANLIRFEEEMTKTPVEVVNIMGHGLPNLITGQNNEILIKQGINDDICKNTKANLWSCLTARQLGPALVTNGCPTYYGYSEPWTIWIDINPNTNQPRYMNTPRNDPFARCFFDCGLATGYTVLARKSPEEVYQATLDRYNYWYNYWMTQDHEFADDIMQWLHYDKIHFQVITSEQKYETKHSDSNLPAILIPLSAAGLLLFLASSVVK